MPFISICIPTYRNKKGLHRLLTSIQLQDYHDYEVIICDDTPDSDAWAVVSDFGMLPGLRYQRNAQRLGSPLNWNRCLDLATGTWIKMMHHDDWFSHSSSLRQFADLAARVAGSPLIFSACNAYRNGETLEFLHAPFGSQHPVHQIHSLSISDLVFANLIGCPSVTMVRSDCGFRFDPCLIWLVDVDYYMAMINQGEALYLSAPLINVTFAADTQITSVVENDRSLRLKETLYLCRKYQLPASASNLTRLAAQLDAFNVKQLIMLWLRCGESDQGLPSSNWLIGLLGIYALHWIKYCLHWVGIGCDNIRRSLYQVIYVLRRAAQRLRQQQSSKQPSHDGAMPLSSAADRVE